MTPEEDKIWRSIQEKDRRVFEQYYKDHYKLFFVAAFKYLEDAGQAQEVVNDVFVTLWQNAEKVIIQSSLKAYLHRSVINRSLNLLDKKKEGSTTTGKQRPRGRNFRIKRAGNQRTEDPALSGDRSASGSMP